MLRYLYGDQLSDHPLLRDTMFRDRAAQFKTRLKWQVDVDENGFERDEYDAFNPLYVILENNLGRHEGSLRLLPTTGRCMINEKFRFLLGGSSLSSPLIWESTRFCLAPKAFKHSASKLMLAAGEVMLGFGVEQSVVVFDHTMRRIYRRIGAIPEILAEQGSGKTYIGLGLWSFPPCNARRLPAARRFCRNIQAIGLTWLLGQVSAWCPCRKESGFSLVLWWLGR